MDYDLELDRVCSEVERQGAKLICIQLPDGLKPRAGEIDRSIRQRTGARVIIWAGSCFGACDVPVELERIGVDLLVQFGHSEWRF